MRIEKRGVAELTQDPNNARTHDEKNIESIKRSLQEFGQQKPIVVNTESEVVAGNGTLAAAADLGWKNIAVVVTDLVGSSATAYAIADNRTAELAAWDEDALADTLEALRNDGDLDELITGFSKEEIEAMIGGNSGSNADDTDVYEPEYLILITCNNEKEQADAFEKCKESGYQAKLIS
jgi:ParB-like chromosome segregation protein Spo0J